MGIYQPSQDPGTITLDKGSEHAEYSTVCHLCKHLVDGAKRSCEAFPQGIPWDIWDGRNKHTEAVQGDRGIRFESRQA